MNDELDEFEAELTAFRPVPPSEELRKRLAGEMALNRGRVRHGMGILLALAAACVALVALFQWLGGAPKQHVTRTSQQAEHPHAVPLPTWGNYARAWARSPAALDELLEQQQQRNDGNETQDRPVSTFVVYRSDAITTWKGEWE